MTENVIFRSQLNVLSLNPPENVNDTVECEITQTSKARSCVTTKEDIYFNSNLTLVSDEDNFIFTCSVSPSVFRNYLRWFWTSSSINASGNVTDYRQNGTRLALDNVNTMSHETFIRCELSWGVFNYSYVDILVPMDTPTTQATSVWTKAPEGKNSVSTQGGMTLDHVDGNERTSVGPHSEDHTMMTMMKSSVSLMSSTSVPSTSVSTTAPEGKNSVSTQGGVILDHVDGTERTSVGPHSEDHTMMTMIEE
ncbi:hypothetical protein BSL78_11628 [Apostichopus japonicus]|uniref:Uncharacterized protein n=1 Tax=Stichopus japonicus TaxID=307972 RepID=A0A2G8KU07_STIJA|nr:hypothetical protein BSL78_11628 [Apostichopus japonicus]